MRQERTHKSERTVVRPPSRSSLFCKKDAKRWRGKEGGERERASGGREEERENGGNGVGDERVRRSERVNRRLVDRAIELSRLIKSLDTYIRMDTALDGSGKD